MLSLTKCKNTLNKNEISYTDEETLILRNLLYAVAEIEYQQSYNTDKKTEQR